jgi:hypothetical protein
LKLKSLINNSKFIGLNYTVFEALSKGGSQLLLIIIASIIDKQLYLKIMLLISFEALITMFYLSYYADILYSFRKNRSKQAISNALDTSILQYLVLILIYLIFKEKVNTYFNYNLDILIFILCGNGLISNIIRFYSVSFQIDLKHSKAILFKSIPFFSSFICSVGLFFLMKDKVLAFFLGKFIGMLFFFIYILIKEEGYKLMFNFNKYYFGMTFKRAKYSFVISFLGWSSNLGFLNFAKMYSNSSTELLLLGLILNIFTLLLLFSNGINQVYVPQLRIKLKSSLSIANKFSKRVHALYFILSVIFSFLITFILFFRSHLIQYLPNLEDLFKGNYLYLIVLLFFINSFHWIATPYLMILDKYKNYFNIIVLLNLISWILILIILFIFGFNNFLFFYFLIKIFDSIGIYLYVKKNLKLYSI